MLVQLNFLPRKQGEHSVLSVSVKVLLWIVLLNGLHFDGSGNSFSAHFPLQSRSPFAHFFKQASIAQVHLHCLLLSLKPPQFWPAQLWSHWPHGPHAKQYHHQNIMYGFCLKMRILSDMRNFQLWILLLVFCLLSFLGILCRLLVGNSLYSSKLWAKMDC